MIVFGFMPETLLWLKPIQHKQRICMLQNSTRYFSSILSNTIKNRSNLRTKRTVKTSNPPSSEGANQKFIRDKYKEKIKYTLMNFIFTIFVVD